VSPAPFLQLLGILALTAAAHVLWFRVVPSWAGKAWQRPRPRRFERVLKWVVATPSFLEALKDRPRYQLAGFYLLEGRHPEVVALCRSLLARGPAPAFEAHVRRRLADSLEALGRPKEAEEERWTAEDLLKGAEESISRQLARGQGLERKQRYAEAIAEYERGLALDPAREHRVVFKARLILAAFNAGRPEESVRWAEAAIADGADGVFLATAQRMAAVALGNLGRLEESEERWRQAHALAVAEGVPDAAGECLAHLADILRKRGRLVEALAATRRAAALGPKATRAALAVQGELFRVWGRFDEALAALRAPREPLPIPANERRLEAVRDLDTAKLQAEAGRPEVGWDLLQGAFAVLGDDAKLGLTCDAAAAWVLAAMGRRDDAERARRHVESRLGEFDRARGTQLILHHSLGKAALALGDPGGAEVYWRRYLDLKPDPVNLPTAWFHLGECRLGLGDRPGARSAYREACAPGLDTHAARLARRRLGELDLGAS